MGRSGDQLLQNWSQQVEILTLDAGRKQLDASLSSIARLLTHQKKTYYLTSHELVLGLLSLADIVVVLWLVVAAKSADISMSSGESR